MNLPGFTATASLNGVNQRYRKAGTNFTLESAEGVIPQLGTTMEEWWNEWMSGDGGGGGGGGTPSSCELAATQAKDQMSSFLRLLWQQQGLQGQLLEQLREGFRKLPTLSLREARQLITGVPARITLDESHFKRATGNSNSNNGVATEGHPYNNA